MSQANRGLSKAEAQTRLERDGPNALESGEKISAIKLFFQQFANLLVAVLLISMLVALLAWWMEGHKGLPGDALTIGLVVLLNSVLGFVQEYRAERTLEALKKATTAPAQVLRDGQCFSIDREQLVVGDWIQLDEGDRVPADAVLREAHALQVDESILTGESVPIFRNNDEPLLAGTTVTNGRAVAEVTATGKKTQLGGIATSLSSAQSVQTPLEGKLERLGSQIGWGVLGISISVAIVLFLCEPVYTTSGVIHILIFAVALAVAAVPEGLPAVLTASLSIGARRLAKRGAVVRRMAAVETLGAVSCILTDKTGTLTHNQMTVTQLYAGDDFGNVSGQGTDLEGTLTGFDSLGEKTSQLEQFESKKFEEVPLLGQLAICSVLANRASWETKGAEVLPIGDPTDVGILVMAHKLGYPFAKVRSRFAQIAELPFSSQRRRMSSLNALREDHYLFTKGSLETILSLSSSYHDGKSVVPITDAIKQKFLDAQERFAQDGLRAIALGYRNLPDTKPEDLADKAEESLICLGLIGLLDPPRIEVKPAIELAYQAGIKVYMLTGDHPATALSIGHQVGIKSERACMGAELEKMSDEELDKALESGRIFARMAPQDKLRIVDRMIQKGEVVAMTGDGVNDAPSLKKAHVGIAMGKAGTAVAVEASDLVLLDDNFATILVAIQEGRGVYANVQKFIAFLFSGNTGVVIAMFAGTILARIYELRSGAHILLPLTAAQILWMNLVTDGAPAVAFSLVAGDPHVMERGVRDPKAPILGKRLWQYLIGCGIIVAILLLLVLDSTFPGGLYTLPGHKFLQEGGTSVFLARTMGFYTVVTTRLLNAFNFRDLPESLSFKNLTRDAWVPGACLLSWIMTVAVIYLPSTQEVFGLVALSFRQLGYLTLISLCVLVTGRLLNRLVTAKEPML